MAEHARDALGDRATVLCQDLVELTLPEPVDAVFSNATFHWIPDHDRLFARLYAAMAPGGRLVAQCGGLGNIDSFRVLAESVAQEEPFAPYFADWRKPWNYAGADETEARLQRAGFVGRLVLARAQARDARGSTAVRLDRLPGPPPRPAAQTIFASGSSTACSSRNGCRSCSSTCASNMVARRP